MHYYFMNNYVFVDRPGYNLAKKAIVERTYSVPSWGEEDSETYEMRKVLELIIGKGGKVILHDDAFLGKPGLHLLGLIGSPKDEFYSLGVTSEIERWELAANDPWVEIQAPSAFREQPFVQTCSGSEYYLIQPLELDEKLEQLITEQQGALAS